MDIASLQAFTVVADNASFSLAAERLHLTQPAVSKRISTLESELDVRLFDRLGRKVMLTEAGRTLLPRALRILSEVEDCRRALCNLSGQISGKLVIATSHHIGLHRLPPILRLYASRHPEVQLEMRFMDSELACGAVGRGDVELAIVTLPPQPDSAAVLLPVWDDPLAVVVSRDHSLLRQARVAPELLGRYPAILPGEATFTRRIIDHSFASLGIPLKVAFSTNYLETIKMMVSVGLGWSLLPKTMLDDEMAGLEVDGLNLRRSLGVVRHTGHTLSNAARAMLNILQNPVAG